MTDTTPDPTRPAHPSGALMGRSGGPAGITVDGRVVSLSALAVTGAVAFRWGMAPAGLATRRQLGALGLRPGGAEPVARLEWRRGRRRGGPRFADLYLIEVAVPKRPLTPGKVAALAAATRARRTCRACGTDAGYVLPTSWSACLDCAVDPTRTPHLPDNAAVAA